MASDNHAPSRRPLDLHFHAATGLVPFGQNRSLICQLCPLGNRGAQPSPCLPLTLVCHHIKPVSQQKPRHRLQLKYEYDTSYSRH